ncbi:MAG: F0F1 ATP synthase subunit epsilon [Paracoccaceae bacterium]|jgi:F-type H+-transporting ATPase subunit epsilon|nr:F0F1 ATP synthase subunit epsilon [Paracoccaceae bacterium]|tara:strand:+ start:2349 stop:2747 length:399 start_codon:yes stop_codon:yes gene_type:complete
MATLMQFDLVSPEAALASMEVLSVQIPGSEGDFTAMPEHAPVITTLRPGIVKVNSDKGAFEYLVTGGFVEINADATSILAEQAYDKDNVSRDIIDGLIKDAENLVENVDADAKDSADKKLADTKLLIEILNL